MAQTNEARHAHWKHHIDQWESSSLSGADYCRQHELTYHCFIYWRSKFSQTERKGSAEARPNDQLPNAFVTVQPPPLSGLVDTLSSDSLHLRLPNGLEIRNIYASNLGNVRLLLERL